MRTALLGAAALLGVSDAAYAVSARDAASSEERQVSDALTEGRRSHAATERTRKEMAKEESAVDPDLGKIKSLRTKFAADMQQRDDHFKRACERTVRHYGLAPVKSTGERTRFKKLKNLPGWNSAAGQTVRWTEPSLWTGGNTEFRIEESRLQAALRFLREGKAAFRGLRRGAFRRGVVYGAPLEDDIVGRTLPDGTILINLKWLAKESFTPNMLAATIFHELVHFEQLVDPDAAELTK